MKGVIEIGQEPLESLYVRGLELPYVEFGPAEPALKLMYGGQEYWYCRTVPVKGHGGVLDRYIQELLGEGKKPLLARFGTRIYIYATGVTPIGAGKAPKA